MLPVLAAVPNADPVRSLDASSLSDRQRRCPRWPWSGDGRLLAAGGYQEVLIWDLANGVLQKRLGTGQVSDTISALAFTGDGRLLAVAEGVPYGAGAVKLFDVESGQVAAVFVEPHDATLCLALSPDSKWLAAAGVDTVVRVWSVDEKKLVAELKGHSDWVRSVCFSADGKLLASAGNDSAALVWDVGTWNRLTELRENDPVCWSRVESRLAVRDAGRRRQGRQSTASPPARQRPGGPRPEPRPDCTAGRRLERPEQPSLRAVQRQDRQDLRRWQLGTSGQLLGHSDWVYRMATVGDASKIATASGDGTVKLWSAADGRLLATLIQLTPRTDEWLIMTASGYLATSSPAAIQWRTAGLTMTPEQFGPLLQNTELVKQALSGTAVAAPAIQ